MNIDLNRVLDEAHNGNGKEPIAPSTWTEIDLAETIEAVQAGEVSRPEPTVGRIEGGSALFYEGRVNSIFAPDGAGKTFLVLLAAIEEMRVGRHVVMVDLEDHKEAAVIRLLEMGAEPDDVRQRFHYVQPELPFGLLAQCDLDEVLQALCPSLVILDSVGEAMSLQGTKTNADEEVAAWYRLVARFIASRGPAVVGTDHVVKDKANGGLFAIGSQRKRAAITGASYLLETVREFGRGQAGMAQVICAKDRHGTYVRGAVVAELEMDGTEPDHLDARLVVPTSGQAPVMGWNGPLRCMDAVLAWFEDHRDQEASKNQTCAALRAIGKSYRDKTVGDALERLVVEQQLSVRGGPRNSRLFRLHDESKDG